MKKRVIACIICLCLLLQCRIMAANDAPYIIPESNTRYLTEDDLSGMPVQVMRYARNEIFARHGRMFKSAELSGWFQEQSWYRGSIPGDQFDDSVLNDYERDNVDLLLKKEANAYALDQPGYSYDVVYDWITSRTGPSGDAPTSEGQERSSGSQHDPVNSVYRAYLEQRHHEDSDFIFDIEGFSLYDVDGDGTDELLTYGGGQIDYTKLFTVSDGKIQRKGATTKYTIYDNGILGSFFGGGTGYDMYTFYSVGSGCELTRLFSYADWFSLGSGVYKTGEHAAEENGETCSWDEIKPQVDALIGNANIIQLQTWDNTEINRTIVFGGPEADEQSAVQDGGQIFSGVVWVTTPAESANYFLTNKYHSDPDPDIEIYLAGYKERIAVLKLDPGTEATAYSYGTFSDETMPAYVIELPDEYMNYSEKHITISAEPGSWASGVQSADLSVTNIQLVSVQG